MKEIMKMMMTTLLTYSILLVQDRDSILQNEITKKTKDLAVYQFIYETICIFVIQISVQLLIKGMCTNVHLQKINK